jgi:hypothetical protein
VKKIGFGSHNCHINFYIANRPPLDDYPHLCELRGLAMGELGHIVANTSNHWRKVFNVYAKLLFDWYGVEKQSELPPSWQALRDRELFQQDSQAALLFSAPQFHKDDSIHIIAGKTYAAHLKLPPLTWLDTYFAINPEHRLIVAPYPDYRQLSNERIARLINLMRGL